MEQRFQVLITVDQRLRFQQNLSEFDLAVIILVAKPCRYPQLKLLAPKVLDALEVIRPGECVTVQSSRGIALL